MENELYEKVRTAKVGDIVDIDNWKGCVTAFGRGASCARCIASCGTGCRARDTSKPNIESLPCLQRNRADGQAIYIKQVVE